MQTKKKQKPHEPKWKDIRKYCTVMWKRALSNQFSVILAYFVVWFLKLPKINNPSFTWLPVVWKQFRKSEIETQISSLDYGPGQWKSVFLQFLLEWAHVYIVNGTSAWCSVIHHQTLNNVCWKQNAECWARTVFKWICNTIILNKYTSLWIGMYLAPFNWIQLDSINVWTVIVLFDFFQCFADWLPKSMKLNRFWCFYFISDFGCIMMPLLVLLQWCYANLHLMLLLLCQLSPHTFS